MTAKQPARADGERSAAHRVGPPRRPRAAWDDRGVRTFFSLKRLEPAPRHGYAPESYPTPTNGWRPQVPAQDKDATELDMRGSVGRGHAFVHWQTRRTANSETGVEHKSRTTREDRLAGHPTRLTFGLWYRCGSSGPRRRGTSGPGRRQRSCRPPAESSAPAPGKRATGWRFSGRSRPTRCSRGRICRAPATPLLGRAGSPTAVRVFAQMAAPGRALGNGPVGKGVRSVRFRRARSAGGSVGRSHRSSAVGYADRPTAR
jgi:hypothetical protein